MNKKKLFIIVEGETEQDALTVLLEPHFSSLNTKVQCIRIGENRLVAGGGNFNWTEFDRHVRGLIRGHRGCFISTCFDYYRLGNKWPKYKDIRATKLDKYAEVRELENALEQLVKETHSSNILWDNHFIPHIQLHELETLLFSQPEILANMLDDTTITNAMRAIIGDSQRNCEMINDNYDTCPSRRLDKLTGGRYTKGKSSTAQAPTFMRQADLAVMRKECRHFDAWLTRLETSLAD